jgi:hypothetical protein
MFAADTKTRFFMLSFYGEFFCFVFISPTDYMQCLAIIFLSAALQEQASLEETKY